MRKQIAKTRVEISWLNNWLMWASIEMTNAEGSLTNAIDCTARLLNLMEENSTEAEKLKENLSKVSYVYAKIVSLHTIIKSIRSEIAENPSK